MSAAVQHSARSSDPITPPQSGVRLRMVKPVVYFIAGLSVAFSGAQHVDLGFDRLLVGIIFLVFAIVQLFDWRVTPASARTGVTFIAAAAAIIAAGLQFAVTTPLFFALTIVGWGVITGVCDIFAGRKLPAQRGDHTFLGVLALVMAALSLAFATDSIAVAGFFGAYAVVAGVFIGISVIDTQVKAKRQVLLLEDTAADNDPASTNSQDSETAAQSAPTTRNGSTA